MIHGEMHRNVFLCDSPQAVESLPTFIYKKAILLQTLLLLRCQHTQRCENYKILIMRRDKENGAKSNLPPEISNRNSSCLFSHRMPVIHIIHKNEQIICGFACFQVNWTKAPS